MTPYMETTEATTSIYNNSTTCKLRPPYIYLLYSYLPLQESDYLHHVYHLYDSEGSESEPEEEKERRERLVRLHSKLKSVSQSQTVILSILYM